MFIDSLFLFRKFQLGKQFKLFASQSKTFGTDVAFFLGRISGGSLSHGLVRGSVGAGLVVCRGFWGTKTKKVEKITGQQLKKLH